jgi:prevent-host-death family protein
VTRVRRVKQVRQAAVDLVGGLVHHFPVAEVNVHQAKTQLSQLLRRVEAGEEIIISRSGTPVARLVPVDQPPRRLLGLDQGLFVVPDDFDAPLPDALLAELEG